MIQGGAIYYNLYRPYMSQNMFENNTAQYGSNIASYPIKIVLVDNQSDGIILSDVASGQVYSPALRFKLVDHDDQIITIDNASTIKIRSIGENMSVSGFAQSVVNQGEASFDQLVFQAKPGSQNVEFQITSLALDFDKISLQNNNTSSQAKINASFRYCESGEVEINGACEVCLAGSYSLGANKTQCYS